MFGDDLNPTVMTERVRSGQVSGVHARGLEHFTQRLRFRQEGKTKNKVGLGTVNKSKGERGNYERMHVLKTMTVTRFMKTCGCNADDAMR